MKKLLLYSLFIATIFSCSKTNNGPTTIKSVSVYYQFSLNDPNYTKLNFSGNWQYLDGQGVKGIILSNYGGVIYALERNCPYNSNDACATVTVQTGNTIIGCGSYDTKKNWVACCNSTFLLDGTLQKGPSTYSLKKYFVNTDASTNLVTVSN